MASLALSLVAASLLNGVNVVGTIACDPCAAPFQAVGVVRSADGKQLYLRNGDTLPTPGGPLTVVTIGDGLITFRGPGGRTETLRRGGFPDEAPRVETSEPGPMLAHGARPPLGAVPMPSLLGR